MCAGNAVALCALELHRRKTIDGAAAAVAIELLACWAEAGACLWIVVEVFGLVACSLFGFAAFVVDRVGQCFVFVLSGKAFIAAAHVVVGDQGFDLHVRQLFKVGLRVVSGIGSDKGVCAEGFLHGFHYGDE